MKTDPKVICNDAIVVLCLKDMGDVMTHHQFKKRAEARGFNLSITDCHNMLSRATGRVYYNGRHWTLSAGGFVYRQHVVQLINQLTLQLANDSIGG